MASLEDIDRKLDRLLFGMAQLHLRTKFPSSEEVFTTADIKEEEARLLKDFQNRFQKDVEEEQKFKRSRRPNQDE